LKQKARTGRRRDQSLKKKRKQRGWSEKAMNYYALSSSIPSGIISIKSPEVSKQNIKENQYECKTLIIQERVGIMRIT
jgi:hypothetical protein